MDTPARKLEIHAAEDGRVLPAFGEGTRGDRTLDAAVEGWGRRYRLTPSERAILRGAIDGLDHRALAKRRGISVDTVKTHVHHLLEKTGDESAADAARRLLKTIVLQEATKSPP